jgi:hypothetical protein
MRIRSIKPEFWRSDDVAELDIFTRLLFIGLWSYVDDHGRGRDNAQLIVADLFPLDDPRESFANVRESLAKLLAQGLILRYEVAGRRFLYICTWEKHQRVDKPQPSRFPSPEDASSQVTPSRESFANIRDQFANDPEIVAPGSGSMDQGPEEQGNMDQGDDAGKPATPAKSKNGTRLPDDWKPTSDLIAYVKSECPDVDGRVVTEDFCDYWHSKAGRDSTKTDWGLTYKRWMRTEQTKAMRFKPAGPASRPSTTEQRVNTGADLVNKLRADEGAARQPWLEIAQ